MSTESTSVLGPRRLTGKNIPLFFPKEVGRPPSTGAGPLEFGDVQLLHRQHDSSRPEKGHSANHHLREFAIRLSPGGKTLARQAFVDRNVLAVPFAVVLVLYESDSVMADGLRI